MHQPDYARLLKQPKVMWIGDRSRGQSIRGLLRFLSPPFELLMAAAEPTIDADEIPSDVHVVMLDLFDLEQAWVSQVLAICQEAPHISVVGVSRDALATLPRGVSDSVPLDRLDAWGLERLISLAVLRRAEAFSAMGRDIDVLTGASSRSALGKRLTMALEEEPNAERPLLLALIDVDGLAAINDMGGERAGDQVLARMGRHLRQTLLVRDTIARVNGGTFAVLCTQIRGGLSVFRVVEKIQAALAPALELPYRGAPASYSMGVAVYPDAGLKSTEIMAAAELALRQAKRQRGTACRYFTSGMGQIHERRQSLEMALRTALRREEFELEYQPQVEAGTGRIQRVEALVRWQHRDRGKLAPADFLNVAEDSGLIIGLGHWAMHRLCADLGRLTHLPVSVNLGLAQLNDPSYVETTLRILAQAGFATDRIQLELTEASIQFNAGETARRMRELADAGMGFAVNDFGSGHSNIGQLHQLPISTVKVGRALTGKIEADRDAECVVRSLVGVARQLGLRAVAEGVESASQLALLSDIGFDGFQGFLLSPPVGAEALQGQLNQSERTRLELIQALRSA